MKIEFTLFVVTLVLLYFLYQARRIRKEIARAAKTPTPPGGPYMKLYEPRVNHYPFLRERALNTSAEHLGLTLPEDLTIVYGAIMDWGMEEVVATVASYQTGDASLYMSSGGAIIGGIRHLNVRAAALRFVALAQHLVDRAEWTDDRSVPVADQVHFYLLTNKGVLRGQEIIRYFETSTSPWAQLFDAGNLVMTEIRKTPGF
jgi:hypothetical protein